MLTPLCPTLDTALLANLLGTADKRGNSPAIDYLLDTLAGMSDNDRLCDVLLCYATLAFQEKVLVRYLEAAGQQDYADAVIQAYLAWSSTPGRWVASEGKLVVEDEVNARRQLRRSVLSLPCFAKVCHGGSLSPTAFIPSHLTWTGAAGDGDLNNPANWSPHGTPANGEEVRVLPPI